MPGWQQRLEPGCWLIRRFMRRSTSAAITKNRVLVIGSSNTDMVVKAARIPKPGETILGGEFATCAGGKGANQAVAAVRAGAKVTFIGSVGRDVFGERALAGLKADGINVNYVAR